MNIREVGEGLWEFVRFILVYAAVIGLVWLVGGFLASWFEGINWNGPGPESVYSGIWLNTRV